MKPKKYLFPGTVKHGEPTSLSHQGLGKLATGSEARGDQETYLAAHASPQLRHAFARSRRRSAHHPGAARSSPSSNTRSSISHLSRKHLTAVANPLDTIDVSSPRKRETLAQVTEAVNRPPFEVADIIREHQTASSRRTVPGLPGTTAVLHAIEHCRTSTLGGHLDRCSRCGHRVISYNSCRNRHCPKCLTRARDQWLEERRKELLPVGYFHVVFTIPHELSWLALQNKKVVYNLLFRTSAATLLEVAADAQHLGAQIGFLSVLHTWGQNLLHHPHVHCVVPVGGLSPDQTLGPSRYPFFLPVKVLSRVFRGKFVSGLKRMFRKGNLSFPGYILPPRKAFRSFLRTLFRHDWVVYAKRPFGGPEHVLHYLARYTHRVAISNHRLVSFAEGKVTFRWKDYAHGNKPVDGSRRGGVPSSVYVARLAAWLRPHPLFRVLGESATVGSVAAVPAANRRSLRLPRPFITDHTGKQFVWLDLSNLWGVDDRSGEAHC